jgi:tyrosine-protein phosphatase SIW14
MLQWKIKIRAFARLHYIAILLAFAVIACFALYFIQNNGHSAVPPTSKNANISVSDKPIEVTPETVREETWAVPIELAGVPNFHKVSNDLYRGVQPTAEGFRQLKNFGVRTIINLRSLHSDREKIANTGLAYENINMKPWHPEDEDVVRFLRIVTDANRAPVFVHCRYGADRTGTMCAIYRIVVQGWNKDKAIKEMEEGGFGFHSTWKNLNNYIRNLDVNDIKRWAELKQ